jgi:hypothetical protein
LLMRAAKKLRAMADRLEADAKRRRRPEGHIQAYYPPLS